MKSRAQRYRYVRHVAMSCFPDGGAAPPTLSYASPQSWTYGAAITPLSPTTTGATSFAVTTGALPTGVTLHPTTGVISGTPTLSKVAANVTIRATGPGGTADATINIAVPSPLYTSLVDYWNLDEASGTGIGSHAGLTLTDNNTVTSDATGGPDGGQVRLFTSGNSERLTRTSESALQVGDIDFTFIAWVKSSDLTHIGGIIGKGQANVAGGEFEIGQIDSSGHIWFIVRKADNSASPTAKTTDVISSSAWSMIEGYHDATNNVVGLRINNGTAVTDAISGGVRAGTDFFGIGHALDFGYWGGLIGRVMFTKRLLTAAERVWLYNAGAGRLYVALATYDGG